MDNDEVAGSSILAAFVLLGAALLECGYMALIMIATWSHECYCII